MSSSNAASRSCLTRTLTHFFLLEYFMAEVATNPRGYPVAPFVVGSTTPRFRVFGNWEATAKGASMCTVSAVARRSQRDASGGSFDSPLSFLRSFALSRKRSRRTLAQMRPPTRS
jgi:hypothetical protein